MNDLFYFCTKFSDSAKMYAFLSVTNLNSKQMPAKYINIDNNHFLSIYVMKDV